MIAIAICDDEITLCTELEQMLVDILARQGIKCEISIFFSSEKLRANIESGTYYDIIFLDIEFARHEINGIEIGRLIRDTYHNNTTSIVFMSWEQRHSMELFEIRPMNFLIKPLAHDKIERTINTYLKISGLLTGALSYKKGHDIYKVQIKDIVCLENRARKVVIHLADGRKDEFYGKLKEVYGEQLKTSDFIFIHGSYVVNFDYVTAVKYGQLFVQGADEPLPISPNRRDEVRAHYLAIMKKRRI